MRSLSNDLFGSGNVLLRKFICQLPSRNSLRQDCSRDATFGSQRLSNCQVFVHLVPYYDALPAWLVALKQFAFGLMVARDHNLRLGRANPLPMTIQKYIRAFAIWAFFVALTGDGEMVSIKVNLLELDFWNLTLD